MKKLALHFILLIATATGVLAQKKPLVNVNEAFNIAEKQYSNMLK